MNTSKEAFIKTYAYMLSGIAPQIKSIPGYQNLFGPHIPGVGDNYWNADNRIKIAFVGKDVGVGKRIENTLEDIESYIRFSSDLMNEGDILNWNLNYGQYATAIIYLLSVIYDVPEEDLLGGKRNDLLSSFVWAQRNSVWNFNSSQKANNTLNREDWDKLNDACKPLDSLNLLLTTTDPDIIFLMCWDIESYLNDSSFKIIKENLHIRLLKKENSAKYIIHTSHPSHWRRDIKVDPFYTKLSAIVEILVNEIEVHSFFK
jgi:hypothetical protein